MDDKKLILTQKKYSGESTVISMRIFKDMLKDIDSVAAKTGRTRNEVLSIALEFALKHLEITEEKEN